MTHRIPSAGFGLLLAACLVGQSPACAQVQDDVFCRPYRLSADRRHALTLQVDNLNFFQNDEFKGGVDDGYTLPGLWLQPRLTYQPLSNLRLEAGAHLLYYSGAEHYPGGRYQSLPAWHDAAESDGKGLHARPFFRVQLSAFRNRLNLVLGNLYGGSNHRLIELLYNPELNLSTDPESGLQVLFDSPYVDIDAWIDWQNFIFRQDDQREQFTLALSARFKLGQSGWYVPAQVVGQHLGGGGAPQVVKTVEGVLLAHAADLDHQAVSVLGGVGGREREKGVLGKQSGGLPVPIQQPDVLVRAEAFFP